MRTPLLALGILAAGVANAQLPSWHSRNFVTSSAGWGGWNVNGTPPPAPGLLTNATAEGVALLRTDPPSADYEVNATLAIGGASATGEAIVVYLRASSDARLGVGGTFYAVEFSNIAVTNGVCSMYIQLWKSLNGIVSPMVGFPYGCQNGMQWRILMKANTIALRTVASNTLIAWTFDSSITQGMPGVGALKANAANGIADVKFHALETQAPWLTGGLAAAAWPNRVDIQWAGGQDGPTGSGVMMYAMYRQNLTAGGTLDLVGHVPSASYADRTVEPNTQYKYVLYVHDTHLNLSAPNEVVIQTPPPEGREPRRTGIRPEGAYFGGAGESIDVQSGNVNFTMPLFTAKGRNGLEASFALNLNSQVWRKDPQGTWQYGTDVGYGYGVRLLLGSVTPVYQQWGDIVHYVYVDGTGAEYRLVRDANGWWRSTEGSLVAYNETTNRLHFPDGVFWHMGAESSQSEQDAGTRYPTTVQDPAGNYLVIAYRAGSGAPGINSSGRIQYVTQLFGATSEHAFGTEFTWDATEHLTRIQTLDKTFAFYFHVPTSLYSPWGSAVAQTRFLWKVREERTNADTDFWYVQVPDGSANLSGELNRVVLPNGGEISWQFRDFTYLGGRVVREVSWRRTRDRGAPAQQSYGFWRDDANDANRLYHAATSINDGTGGDRVWCFDGAGRLTAQWSRDAAMNIKLQRDHVWLASPGRDGLGGVPYIGQTTTTINDPGGSIVTVQNRTLDSYGNVTNYRVKTGDNTREWSYRYWQDAIGAAQFAGYKERYIVDRLYEEKMVQPQMKVLRTIEWDYFYSPGVPQPDTCAEYDTVVVEGYPVHLWALQSGSGCYFGLPVSVTANGVRSTTRRYVTGVPKALTTLGKTVTMTSDWRGQYAVPSTLVEDGQTTTMTWDAMLRLDTTTNPNGGLSDTDYDAYSRPTRQTAPDGQTVTWSYPSVNTVIETVNGNSVTKTLDGFGRTQRTQTTKGMVVDYEYASCSCSPFGKVKRVSLPYKTGMSPAGWQTYYWDILGRITQVDHTPGGITTYVYGVSTAYGTRQTVLVTPPAVRWKKYFKDDTGNVREVEEPRVNVTGAVDVTKYTYDAEGRLRDVLMARPTGMQVRTFEYWPEGQLKKTQLPETGATSYTYNVNRQLETKIDARDRKTVWQYDQWGRVIVVRRYMTSGATQEIGNERVEYYYDFLPPQFYDGTAFALPSGEFFQRENTAGRLAMTRTGASRIIELYSYTDGGQLKRKRLEAEGQKLEIVYEYDAGGRVAARTGPGGRRFVYGYDGLGQPHQLKETISGSDWVKATAVFDDYGRLTSVGGMSYEYNDRGQLSRYTHGSYDVSYNYVDPLGVNDGRLRSQTIGGVTTKYDYDQLGRLASADKLGQWKQEYEYDGFGNLTQKYITPQGQAKQVEAEYPVNPLTNRRTGSGSYDAAGNHIWNPSVVYDTDNRMVAAPVETYDYAPDNRRVVRRKTGTGAFTEVTLWVGGQRAASRTVGGGDVDYILFAGRRFVAYGANEPAPEGADRLGSSMEHKPYGERDTLGGMFATYRRDSETTGLDYADQRYYQPGEGRFMTADPYLASSGTANPVSWNRYSYVEGDPVNHVDPYGLIADRVCEAQYSADDCRTLSAQDSTGNGGGGMYCDQALLPFITTPAECSAWSSMVWHGMLPGVAQNVLPAVVAAGGISVITGSSGITLGTIFSGLGAVLGGIGLGELIYRGSNDKPKPIGRPNQGLPTGTKPLDQIDWLDKDQKHGIKDGVAAGPRDWVGIDPDGNVWTGSPNGEAVNHGPHSVYLP